MLLREGVLPGRGVQGVGLVCLIFGDHLLAAAAVARERVARQQCVRRQDARLDERIGEHDEAAGVAAGHGDALGRVLGERQGAVVAQQGDGFAGEFQVGLLVFGGADDRLDAFGVRQARVLEQAEAELQGQDARNSIVDQRFV